MSDYELIAKERGIDMTKTTLPPLWWPLVFCDDQRLHRHGERGCKCEVEVLCWVDSDMTVVPGDVVTYQWLEFLVTARPVKYQTALMLDGWRAL